MRKRTISRRNPVARALRVLRPKVRPNAKAYRRNRENLTKETSGAKRMDLQL